jgi:hypothetical protein
MPVEVAGRAAGTVRGEKDRGAGARSTSDRTHNRTVGIIGYHSIVENRAGAVGPSPVSALSVA